MSFKRVDLPEPLFPTTAWIFAGSSFKEIPQKSFLCVIREVQTL